jgi:large subunit ribosomal protein L10
MPTLAQKQNLVSELQADIQAANVLILVDYRGLTDFEMKNLRNRLRAANVRMRVAKNTLVKRAAAGTDIEVLAPYLAGPSAVVMGYGDEVGEVVRIVKAFLKESKKENELRAGYLEGNALNTAGVAELGNLPTKTELRGKLLMCIASPLTGLANVLSSNQSGLVRLLDQLASIKESNA